MKYGIGVGVAAVWMASVAVAGDISPSGVVYLDGAVKASLAGMPGDAASGRKVFSNRKQGNCLACHMNSDQSEHGFHGEVGPSLDGVADRWTREELRGIVANAKMMFEGTIMPAFYIDSGYNRPSDKFAGKTILTAQQVEDVVAYLMTLKEE